MSHPQAEDSPQGIAIVGMAGRFPRARNLAEFWRNLRDGVEVIERFSDEELAACGVGADLLASPNYVKAGCLMQDVEMFDAGFFGFSPREAEIMDPQLRFFLEAAWEALEDAGYSAGQHGSVAVFAGTRMSSYLLNVYSNPELVALVGHLRVMLANDKDHLPTWVSYKLNLTGPSVNVQTACSTSLVATHMACQSLLNYECDMALAGGVAIGERGRQGYVYEPGGILSPDGHCRAFDAGAGGTVGGAGVGVVVLKRVEDALRDGDFIHALIRGSAVNNDGSHKIGYTAPSVRGQAEVIVMAHAAGEVEAETISYVEAHGTGTELGDPIEIAALTQAFRAGTDRRGFCAIGSVKTNMGHADAAAGVAGLIKTVLALKHRQIPPSLHFERPNPGIDLADSPFYVNARLSEWAADGGPRRAGVSSFGMGGTNAHLVVEEAPPRPQPGAARPWKLLTLAARTGSALEAMSKNLAEHLRREPGLELADAAYTLQVGRKAFRHRMALVCANAEEAAAALESPDTRRVFTGTQRAEGEVPRVAFMFSGQGAQHVNMARALYETEKAFRADVDACAEMLAEWLGLDLRRVIFPPAGGEEEATAALSETRLTQPALFVVEYALAEQLKRWGVRPQALVGHSIGEYVAATLAGVFRLEEALRLVALRGRLMQDLPRGAMLAVPLGEEEVARRIGPALSLAAVNAPGRCVVSGPVEAVEEFGRALEAEGLGGRRLHTSHAFHSAMVEPILEEFADHVGRLSLSPPRTPLLSNVTGTRLTDAEATDPRYWAAHLRRPVRFADGLRELLADEAMLLVEIGPGETLTTLARQQGAVSAGRFVVSALGPRTGGRSEAESFLQALGRLWVAGVEVDWAAFYGDERRLRVPLPTYPFERQSYWVERRHDAGTLTSQVAARPAASPDEWFFAPTWKRSWLPATRAGGAHQAGGADRAGGTDRAGVADPAAGEKDCSIIFVDEWGLGSRLARRLEDEGRVVFRVSAGEGFARMGEHSFRVSPGRREDYEQLFEELRRVGREVRQVVHLWGVTPCGTSDAAVHTSRRRQAGEAPELTLDRGFYSLLFVAQQLGGELLARAGDGRGVTTHITVVSNDTQDVTGDERLSPAKAALLGPVTVIPQEYPGVVCRNIDLDFRPRAESAVTTDAARAAGAAAAVPGETVSGETVTGETVTGETVTGETMAGEFAEPAEVERFVALLSAEISSGAPERVVAYRGGRRWVQAFEPVRLPAADGPPPRVRERGVYLITGGLGGVGLELASHLARTARARLALVGRTGLPDQGGRDAPGEEHGRLDETSRRVERVRALRELGAEVLTVAADVSDPAQAAAAVEEARRRFGEVNGVIHAAGVVDGGMIQPKTREAAARVLAPKLLGALNLDAQFADGELDFMLLCSSMRALIGGAGTVDYCAANAALDAFAHARAPRAFTVSLNWDGWRGVGMSIAAAEAARGRGSGDGPRPDEEGMTAEEGVGAFARALAADLPQLVVSTRDFREVWERGLAFDAAASLEALEQTRGATAAHPRPSLSTEYVGPRDEVERLLTDLWQRLLGVERVGVHDNFFELGGDSVISIQLIAKAHQAGLRMSPKEFFENQTVAELAAVAGRAAHAPEEDAPSQATITGEVPLTPIQSRFFEQEPANPNHFNQAVLLAVARPLDPALVSRAVAHLLEHHDALRLRCTRGPDGWRQFNADHSGEVPFSHLDFSSLPEGEQGRAVEAAAAELQAGMDLARGPIMRVGLFDLGAGRQPRLFLAVHHLAIDAVSWRILLEDLEAAYHQLERGEQVRLPEKTTSFKRWAELLAEHAQTEEALGEAGYWLDPRRADVRPLPLDFEGGANTADSAESVSLSLSADETRALLREVPSAYHTQINDVLLTALARALAGWAGDGPLLVDVEGHGREPLSEGADVSRTVGWFTTVYPVLLEPPPSSGPGAALKSVKEQLRAVPRRGFGYGLLRHLSRDAALARRLRELPPAGISFLYLGQFDQVLGEASPFAPAPESVGAVCGGGERRHYLLDLSGSVTGGRLQLTWVFSRNLHRRETVERLGEALLAELRSLIEHCRALEAEVYTPSDFPEAGLDQQALDALLAAAGEAGNVEDVHALSPMQEGLHFHAAYEPGSTAYHIQLSYVLRGELDVAAFRAAWEEVVRRHSILRAGFAAEPGGRPLALVRRRVRLPWAEQDWRGLPAAEQEGRLDAYMRADLRRGFDLARAPLLRLFLGRTDGDRHYFVWSFHHLLLDGWSVWQVFKEVTDLYEAYSGGAEPRLEPARPYRDYIAWLRTQDLAQAESFWRGALAGFTEPTALPAGGGAKAAGAAGAESEVQERRLAPATTAALQALAQKHQLTLNTLVQGAWSLLLSRYSGRDDVCFGAVVSGRPAAVAGVESVVGLFINTLPARVRVDESEPLPRWLKGLQARWLEALQYDYSPLVRVQEWGEVRRGLPLFETLLIFENYPVDSSLRERREGLEVTNLKTVERTHYPLALLVVPGVELTLKMEYDTARLGAVSAARLLDHFQTLLENFVTSPGARLSELPLLTEADFRREVYGWNETAADYPRDLCLHELFERRAADVPGRAAVVSDGETLTYGELNRRANRLARHLRRLGAGPESVVGVLSERTPEMVVSLLAVLKAGAAYLPLEPSYPAERLSNMVADAGARLVLTHGRAAGAMPEGCARVVRLDADRLEIDSEDDADPPQLATPENLAYVIYTSGSTGKPKGAMNTHAAIVNRLLWMQEQYGLAPADAVLQKTPFSFDVSVWEFFWPLLVGARLVLARPGGHRDAAYLARLVRRERVTTLHFVPSMLQAFLNEPEAGGCAATVRRVVCSGEALGWGLQRRFFEVMPGVELHNLYGPTEAAVDVTYWRCVEGDESGVVPIGRPVANTQVYVLDRLARPAPQGAAGELYIGGAQVGRGYLGRPALTAERFVPDPFSPEPGTRLYRTGDLVRRLPGGEIEYLGRIDQQVKLRGFRIELGEVEAVLSLHPQVRECVAAVHEESPGDPSLVAYLTADPRPSPAEIQRFLREKLPDYMVPSSFVFLDALPLTPNGKLDRRALPAPGCPGPAPGGGYAPPAGPLEEAVAKVWGEVLGVERVGALDDFFELGGHSLKAAQVAARLRAEFGVELPLNRLFDSPTVAATADLVLSLQAEQLDDEEVARLLSEIEQLPDGEAEPHKGD